MSDPLQKPERASQPPTEPLARSPDPTAVGIRQSGGSESRDSGSGQPTMAFDRAGAAISAAAPDRFGDYEILEQIGRGGMGVVYKARQVSLNRIVAVKTILAGQLASEEEVRRFYVGAEVAAGLSHPGIVPVYEAGQHAGQHYFSMAFVEGQSLAAKAADGPLPPRQAAGLVREVAEAIAHAHQRGLIHRDLKPANILLDRNGRPQVSDFDLAKRIRGDSHLTEAGQVLGTPSYMSPEQAAGTHEEVGPPSDVYSLGAILYDLLTGRPPFEAATAIQTLTQVLDEDPVPVRVLNAQVPHDLETIVMKCLQKDPSVRYATATDLADDLARFLQGEPILASSINLLDRVTRALVQGRHEEHFQGWGLALMAFGLVIFLAHLWMFAMIGAGHEPGMGYWLPRGVMFLLMLGILWYARPYSLLPTNAAERPIWAIWIGYLIATGMADLVLQLQGRDFTEVYALGAVLSGLGFFAMGSHVWGGCYVVGLVFMAAAPCMAVERERSAVWLGALWLLALAAVGIRYWRLGCRQRADCQEEGNTAS